MVAHGRTRSWAPLRRRIVHQSRCKFRGMIPGCASMSGELLLRTSCGGGEEIRSGRIRHFSRRWPADAGKGTRRGLYPLRTRYGSSTFNHQPFAAFSGRKWHTLGNGLPRVRVYLALTTVRIWHKIDGEVCKNPRESRPFPRAWRYSAES